MLDTIINQAVMEGVIEEAELKEYIRLKQRLRRLDRLSWSLHRGEKESFTQQDVADILGVSQQLVAKSEQSGLIKVKSSLKELKLDRHIQG